jgi:hypothetical protein
VEGASDRLLDIFRVRQYFNAITAARQLVELARQDTRFLDAARRALLPLPFETWPLHHGPVFPARSRERLSRLHGRRVAVIASGGSGATAAVIGVMRALEEVGVKPALMSLCSGSAFFGLPVAAGQAALVPRYGAATGRAPGSVIAPNPAMGDGASARRKLDRILGTLEQLNLRGTETMPARLRTELEVLGIGAASKPDFTVLIDHVLELQEELLHA